MRNTMPLSGGNLHQNVARSLADVCQKTDQIVAKSARELNESGADFTASDRQFLYDLQRLDSSERRRSAFHAIDRFTELASRCPDVVAFNVADRIRARILVMREIPLLDMPLVMKDENQWNCLANHDEVLFGFDPANPSRVDALWHSWGGQIEATRIARDTLVSHHARRRLISVSR